MEQRIVPTAVTAYEQYFLELINRARLNPDAEAARLGITLNEGLAAGTLPSGTRQPLALNDALQTSIELHVADELAHNFFSHTGSNGSTVQQRIEAAGYSGWITIGENLAIQYTTGSINIEQFVTDEYVNLFKDLTVADRGHRINIVNGNFKEVGSAVQVGVFQGANAVNTGNDFGARRGDSFLTGVIYTDSVSANNFYNVGEGMGGISVDVTSTGGANYHTTANAAGGYQVALPAGTYRVRFSGAGLSLPIDKAFTIGSLNVKVDANTRTDAVTSGPPALAGTNPILYVAGAAATPINSAIVVADPGRATLSSATITIGNFVSNQDVLGFIPNPAVMGNIGITSNGNGVLQLSSVGRTATLAQWQTALRSVTYANNSSNASTVSRNVTFVVDDGQLTNHVSNVLATSITVFAFNTPPSINSLETTVLDYNARDPGIALTSTLNLNDPDSLTLVSATVQIATGYQVGADTLTFANTGNIVGAFDPSTGRLTLSGFDSVSNYRTALRSVRFANASATPVSGLRTIIFQVNDGFATNNFSSVVSRKVNLKNGALPVLAGVTSTAVAYSKNDPATLVAPAITISDADSVNLSGAAVQITGNYIAGLDGLSVVNTSGVTASFNGTTGVLSLFGTASLADYQTMLRSVRFASLQNSPVTATRTILFVVLDTTGNLSNAVTRTIGLSDAAFPPNVKDIESIPLNYRGGNPAIAVTSSVAITDPVSNYITAASIRISANYQNGQDLLSFANTSTLTATWNAATGTLTIVGVDTVSNYRTALRNVLFQNSSATPSLLPRTISFQVSDLSTGALNSNVVSRTVSLAVTSPPLLKDIETGFLSYRAGDAAKPLTTTLAVTDADSDFLSSATIQITANYQNGQDLLGFVNTPKLTAVWTAATGTLRITGVDTLSNYRTALRKVLYQNTSATPNALVRSVTFQVSDLSTGVVDSNTAVRNIALSIGASPILSRVSSTVLAFTKNDPAVVVAPGLTIADADSVNLTGASIRIAGGFVSGQDQLTFANSAGVTAAFDPTTGTLTLSGTKTLAAYQTMLRTVAFQNSSNGASTPTRTIEFFVTDDAGQFSNRSTRTVSLSDPASPPVLRSIETTPLSYVIGSPATAVTSTLAVTDPDSNYLTAASIRIVTNYQNGQDLLSFASTSTLTATWNAATGTLTITGVDTVSNYRTALRSVLYRNSSTSPSLLPRLVSFQVSDLSSGALNSNTASRTITYLEQ